MSRSIAYAAPVLVCVLRSAGRVSRTLVTTSILAVVVLSGCARAHPRDGFSDVDRLIRARTGAGVFWSSDSAADVAAADTVQALLATELGAEQAVRVGLLASRDLQATYEELGIARADVVQAGLIQNPILSLSRITSTGPGEFGLAQTFVDLLQRPMRKRLAGAAFEVAKVRVADAVYQRTTDVRASFYTLVAAEQTADLRRTIVRSVGASASAALAIRAAGNLLDVDLATELALAEQARADAIAADADAVGARERLVREMGVTVAGNTLRVSARLPALPGAEMPSDSLVSLAVLNRLDLSGTFAAIEVAGRSLGLTNRFRLLMDGSVGWNGTTDFGKNLQQGPSVSLPIPLFDRGQATSAAGRARLRQAYARHAALASSIRSEVRGAAARTAAMRARADLYRTRIVPLRNRALQETLLQSNAMAISVFTLLLAKQAQIDAGVGYVSALRDYWMARVELERVVGTVLPTAPAVETPVDRDILGTDTMSVNGTRMPHDSANGGVKADHDSTTPMEHAMPMKHAMPASGMSDMPGMRPKPGSGASPSRPASPRAPLATPKPVAPATRPRTPPAGGMAGMPGMSGMPMPAPAKPPAVSAGARSPSAAPRAAPAAPAGSKTRGRTPATDSASTRVPRP